MYELSDWQQRARQQGFIEQAIIGGRRVAALSGATFAAINPASGQVLAQVAACAEAEVDLAVRSARQAFEAGVWS
ncbi:aldehyde dehydrogenase family protein, partial [Bowmanella yangjiangensis]|nr:aldehyde dehydrogenase family protein [Bowmanella yangjiangensis]